MWHSEKMLQVYYRSANDSQNLTAEEIYLQFPFIKSIFDSFKHLELIDGEYFTNLPYYSNRTAIHLRFNVKFSHVILEAFTFLGFNNFYNDLKSDMERKLVSAKNVDGPLLKCILENRKTRESFLQEGRLDEFMDLPEMNAVISSVLAENIDSEFDDLRMRFITINERLLTPGSNSKLLRSLYARHKRQRDEMDDPSNP